MIMLVGGGGFLGLNTARYLLDNGEKEVLMVGRSGIRTPSFLASYANKQIKVGQGDILDLHFLYGLIREHNVDSIIYFIGGGGRRGLYHSINSNVSGINGLLEAARINRMRRVSVVSSEAVYEPNRKHLPCTEDRDLPVDLPQGGVGAAKRILEQICLSYAREYSLSIAILRPPHIWGPRGEGDEGKPRPIMTEGEGIGGGGGIIDILFANAVAGKVSEFPSPGMGQRGYVYVRDCAKGMAMVHLAPKLKHEIYNVSDGELHNLRDFAKAIKEVIPKAQIMFPTLSAEREKQEALREYPTMPIDRIREDVGFTPDYNLSRAARAYIDWLRKGEYN